MAHQHPVVDSDIRFSINPVTRAITRVNATKSSLVVGDHNSERFTFEIPKTVEGHDMSLCNVVRIHYLNTSSENKSIQSLGVYEVDDFAIDSEDETKMTFSWLISRKATKYVGPLSFTIQFACMTGFKLDYSWQSGVFSGITVSNSVNGAEVVIEEYADILRQWWEQLYASSDLPITVMPVEDFAMLDGDTRPGMLYILSDDPAVEDLEKIPSIERKVKALETHFGSLDEEVEDIKDAIPDIRSSMTSLSTTISSLDEEVEANQEEITQLKSAVEDINGRTIPNVSKALGTLNLSVGNLDKKVEDIKENIGSLGEEVENIKENIGSNTDDLKTGLEDGSVIPYLATRAECDGNSENIANTYERKDSKKIYEYQFDNSSDVTVNTEFEIGSLPTGKTVNDIVGIGLEMGFSNEDYLDETPHQLNFSAGKTYGYVTNPVTGRKETPFSLSAVAQAADGGAGIALMNVILGEKDHKLYLKFNNGFYTKIDADVHILNSGGFYVLRFIYWFT